MEQLDQLFGRGGNLNEVQMSLRTLVVFIICLLLIRLSGRRSFGMHMPLDNVITILLGAVLSRAIVGASPFIATIASATMIALLHRCFGWLGFYSRFFGRILKGREKIIYSNGKFIEKNMRHCMISRKDLEEAIRSNSNLNSLESIESVYVERDGSISVVKKP